MKAEPNLWARAGALTPTRFDAVVVDTNIVFGNTQLQGELWDACERAHLRFHFPAVVVRELAAQEADRIAREAYKKEKEAYGARRRQLAAMPQAAREVVLGERPQQRPPTLEAISSIEAQLRATIASRGWTVLGLPEIPHSEVLDRLLAGRKPFARREERKKDVGYCDFLIWATVMSLVESNMSVALVTTNTKDFADTSDRLDTTRLLHDDLLPDARGLMGSWGEPRFPQECQAVRLYTSLAQILERVQETELLSSQPWLQDLAIRVIPRVLDAYLGENDHEPPRRYVPAEGPASLVAWGRDGTDLVLLLELPYCPNFWVDPDPELIYDNHWVVRFGVLADEEGNLKRVEIESDPVEHWRGLVPAAMSHEPGPAG